MSGRTQVRDQSDPSRRLGPDGLFLVWGPPSYGPRSEAFARELAIDLEFVYWTKRRGLLISPLKYGYQAVKTTLLLLRRRPPVIFVQSPPSFAVMWVALYCALTAASFLVDAHSAAMQSPYWTRPAWLFRYLNRRALATIVTNEHFAEMVRGCGGRALVVPDILTTYPGRPRSMEGTFNVVVVTSFSADEPLQEVMMAAGQVPEARFHVTGDRTRRSRDLPRNIPDNVRFTGFLPTESYYDLMASSDAVMCLTTRDHTMQCGACEALSMGKPIITSNWPVLMDYFSRGTLHVDNSAVGIRDGVREMMRHHSRYEGEIRSLQSQRRREWQAVLASLLDLVDSKIAPEAKRKAGRVE